MKYRDVIIRKQFRISDPLYRLSEYGTIMGKKEFSWEINNTSKVHRIAKKELNFFLAIE
jgi:hypothetical protein